jgi:hypothetical protein
MREVEGGGQVQLEDASEVRVLGLVHAPPRREAADEVHDRFEVLHGRDRLSDGGGIEQVRVDERRPVAELLLRPAALRLDHPGDRTAIAGVEQLGHDGPAEGARPTRHEDAHVRNLGRGATPCSCRLSRPRPALPWQPRWSNPP